MKEFLDAYNVPILNQDAINNLNSSIASNETKAAIKDLPTK